MKGLGSLRLSRSAPRGWVSGTVFMDVKGSWHQRPPVCTFQMESVFPVCCPATENRESSSLQVGFLCAPSAPLSLRCWAALYFKHGSNGCGLINHKWSLEYSGEKSSSVELLIRQEGANEMWVNSLIYYNLLFFPPCRMSCAVFWIWYARAGKS